MDVMRERQTRSSRCGSRSVLTTLAVRCSALAAHWPFSERCGRCVSSRRQVAASCASASSARGISVARLAGCGLRPAIACCSRRATLRSSRTWWPGSAHSPRMARCHRRSPSAMRSFSSFRTSRCRNSVETTAVRFKARSYSTPAMPYQRAGVIADEVEREGVGITSQKYLPGTHLVRAFNTLAYTIFVREANRPDPKLAIPIAGDDSEALAIAAGLVRDAGFEPVVVGKLVDARRFQRGAPGYGQSVTAAELRQTLWLPPASGNHATQRGSPALVPSNISG